MKETRRSLLYAPSGGQPKERPSSTFFEPLVVRLTQVDIHERTQFSDSFLYGLLDTVSFAGYSHGAAPSTTVPKSTQNHINMISFIACMIRGNGIHIFIEKGQVNIRSTIQGVRKTNKRVGRNEQGKLERRTGVSGKNNENTMFMMKGRIDPGWVWVCISKSGLSRSISARICALAGYHFSFDLDIDYWVSQVEEVHCLKFDTGRYVQ